MYAYGRPGCGNIREVGEGKETIRGKGNTYYAEEK